MSDAVIVKGYFGVPAVGVCENRYSLVPTQVRPFRAAQ